METHAQREGRRTVRHHRHLVVTTVPRRLHTGEEELYPDDELLEDCCHRHRTADDDDDDNDNDNDCCPATPGTMKTASSLNSTRSRESVLVQVGQPFDEPLDDHDDHHHHHDLIRLIQEEKKEEEEREPIVAAAAVSAAVAPLVSGNHNIKNTTGTNARILMLMSTFGRSQLMHQERAVMLFESMGIPYETIDGSAPNRKDERNALFQLSGLRGIYPQFFLVQGGGGGSETDDAAAQENQQHEDNENDDSSSSSSNTILTVIGNFDALEGINEASTLPTDVLQNNPEILTWDRLMGKTKSERLATIQLTKRRNIV